MSDYPPNATPVAPAPASGGLRVYADADGNVWGRDPATGIAYLLSSVGAPIAAQAPGIGMAYGYFAPSPIVADGNYHLINTIPGAGGVYGNAALFAAVPDGIEVIQPVIVSVMLWAREDSPAVTEKLLAVQLDKQKGAVDPSMILNRVPTGFIWTMASAVYQGILLAGDIVRAVAKAPDTSGNFNIMDGYATVLGVPVSI